MIKQTLNQASESLIRRLVIGLVVRGSAPDLEPLYKENQTRKVAKQEGLTWVIDELFSSLVHIVYLSNTYKPATILADPKLPGLLLASIRSKTVYVESTDSVSTTETILHTTPLQLISRLQSLFFDPTEYLIMSSHYLLGWSTKDIQNKYGLDSETVISTIQAGFQTLRNEVWLQEPI